MEPTKVGKHFIYGPANAITQVFAPADNVNGAVLQTALLLPKSGAINLYVGPVAPTSTSDASVPFVFAGYGNANQTVWKVELLPYPLLIPAGMGMWIASSSVSGGTSVTWDYLS